MPDVATVEGSTCIHDEAKGPHVKRVQVLGHTRGEKRVVSTLTQESQSTLVLPFLCHAPRIHSDCDDQVQRMTDRSPTMSSLLTQLSPPRGRLRSSARYTALGHSRTHTGAIYPRLRSISCPLTQGESHNLHVDQGALMRLNISVCRKRQSADVTIACW